MDPMDREWIEERIAQARPGWRVVGITEVNDEAGPSFTRRTIQVGGVGDVEDRG